MKRLPPWQWNLGVFLLILGVALLIASLSLGWFTISTTYRQPSSSWGSGYVDSSTVTFFPFEVFSGSGKCSGTEPACLANPAVGGIYPPQGIDGLTSLFFAVGTILAAGIVLGGTSAVLVLIGPPRWSHHAMRLAIITLLLAVMAAAVVSTTQQAVLHTGAIGVFPNAWAGNSFIGSCSNSECGPFPPTSADVSSTWGPTWGWYLCLGSAVSILAGLITIQIVRESLPEESLGLTAKQVVRELK